MTRIDALLVAASAALAACAPPTEADLALRTSALTLETRPNFVSVTQGDRCLAMVPAATGDGGFVAQVQSCNGSGGQAWRLQPSGLLESQLGPCLDVPGRSWTAGAQLVGAACDPFAAAWTLTGSGQIFGTGGLCVTSASSKATGDFCSHPSAQRWGVRALPSPSPATAFGFGSLRALSNYARLQVPLLRIYVNYLGTPLGHPVSYYEGMIFGPSPPGRNGLTLNGYLAAVSSGLFQLGQSTPPIGPVSVGWTNTGCDTSAVLQNDVAQALAGSGIDVGAYDIDQNGQVTPDELAIMVIGNCGLWRNAGASRGLACFRPAGSSADLCNERVIEIEDLFDFSTFTHETLHNLRAVDIYNLSATVNGFSVMGGTILPNVTDGIDTLWPDAWHRMAFGWDEPRVVTFLPWLPAHGSAVTGGDSNTQTVLLGTPSSYVLLEDRSAFDFDASLAANGTSIWQVGQNPDLSLASLVHLGPLFRDWFELPLNGQTLALRPTFNRATNLGGVEWGWIPRAAAFVSQSVPATVAPGATAAVEVKLTNAGSVDWDPVAGIKLGSQSPQDNTLWGTSRVLLPADVPAGGTATFDFTITAPSTVGSYAFQWRMVKEGVEWFGPSTLLTTINVSTPGGAPPPATGPDPKVCAAKPWLCGP